MYDCGQSLNPLADIGQIEGAFIQGVGFYTTEEVVYDNQGMVSAESGTHPCATMQLPTVYGRSPRLVMHVCMWY